MLSFFPHGLTKSFPCLGDEVIFRSRGFWAYRFLARHSWGIFSCESIQIYNLDMLSIKSLCVIQTDRGFWSVRTSSCLHYSEVVIVCLHFVILSVVPSDQIFPLAQDKMAFVGFHFICILIIYYFFLRFLSLDLCQRQNTRTAFPLFMADFWACFIR